jgi:ABC-type polysaccharide/polyol phosphate transport system ATPase subunit
MTSAIEVEGVRKAFLLPHEQRTTFKEYFLHPFKRIDYETQVALADVAFTVEQGEFFGIIGPNGSGKSTLLKIVSGIYRQDAGHVRVNGRLSPFIELGVGFNPELTARDNIRINGTLLGMTRGDLDARFESIIAFAELERFVDQKLKNFSSGMQLRLAYSIAIQVEFDILLLDEVLAVGDASFQAKCFESLEELRAAGKTIVYVTHDLVTVETLCDRALLLLNGEQVALGPAADVVEAYVGETGVAPQPTAR